MTSISGYPESVRLAFLVLAVFLASVACGFDAKPDREGGRDYSGAFLNWFYQTNAVAVEAGRVQEALVEVQDEEGLRMRLRELATTQTSINARFSSTDTHPFWGQHQPRIIAATNRFDAATAHLREDLPFGPLESLVELFRSEENELMQAVISCYTQTDECPEPAD